jgi:hypothetical protein
LVTVVLPNALGDVPALPATRQVACLLLAGRVRRAGAIEGRIDRRLAAEGIGRRW